MKKTLRTLVFGAAFSAVLLGPAFGQQKIDIPFKATTPVTFSMMFSDSGAYPYKDTWTVFKNIEKATGVKLNVMIVPSSEYTNKRNLLMASGDAPQIIPKTYPGQEVPFIASEQILPISDYVKDMPNFSASIKAWGLEDDLKTITQKDGKYYVLPGLHQSFSQDYSIAMRTDILKKHNIAIPTTWDEVEKVLRKLKALYPDITPYSDRWMLGAVFNFSGPSWGVGSAGIKTPGVNWSNNSGLTYDDKSDKYFFYATSVQYKAMLEYFARLAKDGLLDKESAIQTDDQALAKFYNGKSFMVSCNGQEVNNYRTKMDATLGAGNYEVTRINVPAGPAGPLLTGGRLENGIMFPAKVAKDPNFKSFLKFVDWLWYSYSGQELTKWGIENETFVKENGQYKPKAGYFFSDIGFPAAKDTDLHLRKDFGYGSGVFILTYGGPDDLMYSYMSKENKEFTALVTKTHKVIAPRAPIPYTDDQLEAQNMIQTPLMDYVFQMTYKFILGQVDVKAGWDDYVKQCVTKGADRLTNTANAVYQASKKK